jgi:hypothetical protein
MFRDRRVLALFVVGNALFVLGWVGEAMTGGLGGSVHRFTPQALGWSAVSYVGAAVLGIGLLLGARRATRPGLVRAVGLVFLLLACGLLASMPFVAQQVH